MGNKNIYPEICLHYNLVNIIPINNLSKKKLGYINMSIDAAEKSDFERSKKMGSICIVNGKIFDAYNVVKIYKKREYFPSSIHAEINVLSKSKSYFQKNRNYSSLYVVRIMEKTNNSRKYKIGISKPCLYCQQILFKYNVQKIFYTDIINDIEVLCELNIK
jgi:hypothetical protein